MSSEEDIEEFGVLTMDISRNMPFDIISSIVSYLHHADILVLSSASRYLRECIAPMLFKDVHWPYDREEEVEFYPRSTWPYIKYLTFYPVRWPSRQKLTVNLLTSILPHLQNLVVFNYKPLYRPSTNFIEAFSSISLTTIELTTPCLVAESPSVYSTFRGIRKLVFRQHVQDSWSRSPPEHQKATLSCMSSFIFALHDTLEFLELPGEYLPMSSFLTEGVILPHLKIFILTGFPPLEISMPMHHILRFMPVLVRLEIYCRLRIIGAIPQRLKLMPIDETPPPGSLHLFPSQLHSLILSNPSLNDRVFIRFPPSLRVLTLDFTPDWENVPSRDLLAYHAIDRLRDLLTCMKVKAPVGGFRELEELCLKIGWHVTPEVLGLIGAVFPNLRKLEIEGIRYFFREMNAESQMESFLRALSSLNQVVTLKLALEHKEDEFVYKEGPREVGSVTQSMHRWSSALMNTLPHLQRWAFEMRPFSGRDIGPRLLVGEKEWIWWHREGNKVIMEKHKVDHGRAREIRGLRKTPSS